MAKLGEKLEDFEKRVKAAGNVSAELSRRLTAAETKLDSANSSTNDQSNASSSGLPSTNFTKLENLAKEIENIKLDIAQLKLERSNFKLNL